MSPMIQITEYTNERATTVERGENLMMVVAVTVGRYAPKHNSDAMAQVIQFYLADTIADLLAAAQEYGHNAETVIAKAMASFIENQ